MHSSLIFALGGKKSHWSTILKGYDVNNEWIKGRRPVRTTPSGSGAFRWSRGNLEAIKAPMGYIEFAPSGEIIDANDNGLNVIGYSHREVQGQHHRMLWDSAYANSEEYQPFWRDLAADQPAHGATLKTTVTLSGGRRPTILSMAVRGAPAPPPRK